jgi:glycosyltransferase involved in cell wall biosynthesis
MRIIGDNTVFVILSFEGPDRYSLAGGLGVRVTNLSQTLSHAGFQTHLFFVGDPKKQGEELDTAGKMNLHRWCQWISEYYPNGVYQGENDKVNDFNQSIPPFIIDRIVKPALVESKLVVILSEEWHTAEAVCRLNEQLRGQRLEDRVVTFWNANNTFGFDQLDWPRLAENTTITTVSRYMKQIMRQKGVNPLVIPNGIPKVLIGEVDGRVSHRLRERLKSDLLFTKVARYDTTKGWEQAVEATARVKRSGKKTVLLARGGIESYGEEVMYIAKHLGLKVRDAVTTGDKIDDCLEAISGNDGADVVNIKFHCLPELLRILYHASDAVLANSNHEPFGLVGLETMAAGGVAFTGGTGEDYAIHLHNSIVLETSDPREIETYVTYLDNHAGQEESIRKSGKQTAIRFTWEEVIKNLIEKTETQASIQGILQAPIRTHSSQSEARELLQATPVSQALSAAVS